MKRALKAELARIRGSHAAPNLMAAIDQFDDETARQLLMLLRNFKQDAEQDAKQEARRRILSGRW